MFIAFAAMFMLMKYAYAQTVDETIAFLNDAFAKHSIGATNFSFKKENDKSIVATNSVTVPNYGTEKLTYRFYPKAAISVNFLANGSHATIIFHFKANSVEWFEYTLIELLDKIQCSLTNITREETEEIIKAYRHIIKLYGGSLQDDEF